MTRLSRSFLLWFVSIVPVLIGLGIAAMVLVSLPYLAGIAIMGEEIDWREWLGACVALGGTIGALMAIAIASVEA